MELPRFTLLDTFNISGVGTMFTVRLDVDVTDARKLPGSEVLIDGQRFLCRRVERPPVMRQLAAGDMIAILAERL